MQLSSEVVFFIHMLPNRPVMTPTAKQFSQMFSFEVNFTPISVIAFVCSVVITTVTVSLFADCTLLVWSPFFDRSLHRLA